MSANYADLPLHNGHVPQWMLKIMREFTEVITKFIIEEKGVNNFINALSDPLWFQAFNNAIGMDWDSSGSTTVLLSLIKDVSMKNDLGFLVFGGKGKQMLNIKDELNNYSKKYDLDINNIMKFSKIAAKADSSFLLDGYSLYIHTIIVPVEGKDLLVIQQGMNPNNLMARRYHVNKAALENPNSGITGIKVDNVIDATSEESRNARKLFIDLLSEGKNKFRDNLVQANNMLGRKSLDYFISNQVNKINIGKYYYPIIPSKKLLKAVDDIAKNPPSNEIELALTPNVGPRLVRALALISDVIYSVPVSHKDPVNLSLDPFSYSYTIGGKDGIPYPFDAKTAKEAIEFLRNALEEARINDNAKKLAIQRLNTFIRRLKFG
ncbi:hypothetical protein Calag_1468 [Caldisphaera lagunensis DSM 15908]|uniref:DUF763 domain-containing protein n=1 Tax=Caldisphaera lagunensis (strain DSM 15908 / JCM 11604 / ANMR 0165 / IC-154) TaxID=1056495 RepID=L0ABD9_CALLD|nr:DUF763 domain-containing protein [Caldisphaera lagunensis]AFZ71171.1 hypothetical protein Calag_1468 [Caldisphaera lagunensis DSM 15908]